MKKSKLNSLSVLVIIVVSLCFGFSFKKAPGSDLHSSFSETREVKIGDQIWMSENLNTNRFRNGNIISEAKTKVEWETACKNRKPIWAYYNFDSSNGKKYGKIYNLYAVMDTRGLAPLGWHVAKEKDWEKLCKTLEKVFADNARNPENLNRFVEVGIADYLKSDNGWDTTQMVSYGAISNIVEENIRNGSNLSGFSALPGGNYTDVYNPKTSSYDRKLWNFEDLGKYSFFWCMKELNQIGRYSYNVFLISNEVHYGNSEELMKLTGYGFYIRCAKD